MHRTLPILMTGLLIWGCADKGGSRHDPGSCPEVVPRPAAPPSDPAVTGGAYEDPIEPRFQIVNRSENQEILIRPDGLILYCTGIHAMNILDGAPAPTLTHRYRVESTLNSPAFPRCQHVASDGDLAWMSVRSDELQPVSFVAAFDLTTSPPTEVGNLAHPDDGNFEGIVARGDLLFAATHDDGLAVLSVQTGTIEVIGTLDGLGNAWDIDEAGGRVYVTDANGSLHVVDVGDPTTPTLLGSVTLPGAAQAVAVDSATSTAYVAAGAAGLAVVDVTDPAAPVVVNTTPMPGTAIQVDHDGATVAVAAWRDFRVFDVSDPHVPRIVGTETVSENGGIGRTLGAAVLEPYVYAAEWRGIFSFESFPNRLAPDLWLGNAFVEFGQVMPGCRDRAVLTVENHGNAPLVASEIAMAIDPGDAFAVAPGSLSLAPGELELLDVVFTPPSNDQWIGTARIDSDDPDEGQRFVDLLGNRPGVGPGDLAPEVEIELYPGGGVWRLSEARGSPVVLAYFATF